MAPAQRAWETLQTVLRNASLAARPEARAALQPLSDYDKKHDGDLVGTLRSYLEHGCNASRTADALYLHRSGLLYRLRRIEELLDVRLDRFEDRVALEIAVLALKHDLPNGNGN